MAPRTKYDLDLFRKLVKKGKTKTEIMAEMSIKNHPTFNSLKLKLMDTDGRYYAVKESSKKAAAKKVLKAAIGKNNTLTLSFKMLESSEFNPGDYFAYYQRGNMLRKKKDFNIALDDYKTTIEMAAGS